MKLNKQHPDYQADLNRILAVEGINRLENKTIIITGATGLIGIHLIDALMKLGTVNVCAVGRNMAKAKERLGEYFGNSRFCFIEHDVTQPFPSDLTAHYIIPLASHTHPLAYSQYPIETIMVNIKGAEHALRLAQQCHAVVLYPSTVEVYGNAVDDIPFNEDSNGYLTLATSRACYTESKRASEALCQSFIAEFGVDVRVVRLSRLFGPTMLPDDTKASSQFIGKAIANEDIVLKSPGLQIFSYTYVTDAVCAMLHVMFHGQTGVPYNISNPSCDVQLKKFAAICAETCGRQVVFDLPSDTEKRGYSIASRAVLNSSRLMSLGFSPHYSIDDAIRRTIAILHD